MFIPTDIKHNRIAWKINVSMGETDNEYASTSLNKTSIIAVYANNFIFSCATISAPYGTCVIEKKQDKIDNWYTHSDAYILSGGIIILLCRNHKPTVSANIITIMARMR